VTAAAASAAGLAGAMPRRLAAIAAVLLLGLATALAVNPWAGLALLALGLVLVARPLEPLVAMVLAAGAAAFAAYGETSIQRDLAIVLVLTVYATLSFAVAAASGRWSLPLSGLSVALLALAVTTGVAVVHGLARGNPVSYLSLEVFPLAVLVFALGVGGLRLGPGDLRLVKWALVLVGLAGAGYGFFYFATTGMRAQGVPFSPVPGLVALVLLTLMLFDPAPRPRPGTVVLFGLLVLHQILTFTRGFWLGLIVGVPFACAVYLFHRRGGRAAWRKVLVTLGLVGLVLVLGLLLASSWLGLSETIGLLGGRLASSFETENRPETVSNIVRLVELRTSLLHILASPWIGYGHGSTLVVRQFFFPRTGPQWYVHQSYVMISLKQGLIGLLAFLWVLFAALRLGLKGAARADGAAAGWSAASAVATAFTMIVGLTNYFYFMVTMNFLLALLWGIALSASGPERLRMAWRAPAPAVPGPGAGVGS
jgi:O-antigen ligase